MSTTVLRKLTPSQCTPEGIARIIKEKSNPRDLNYGALIFMLQSSGAEEGDKGAFLSILSNLRAVVTMLDRECGDVFRQVVSLKWELEGAVVREGLKQFLISLISSQPHYTNKTIDRVVKELALVGRGGGVMIHHANLEILQFIADKMPVYLKYIQEKLSAHFPHKTRGLSEQQSYVRNLLTFSEMVPSFFSDVILLLIERFVKIDVDISQTFPSIETLFYLDRDVMVRDVTGSDVTSQDDMTSKLDVLLSEFLSYMKLHVTDATLTRWCQVLLLSFQTEVLRADLPPNTPYITFYFFNMHPSLSPLLLDYYWSVFTDLNQPAIIRESGVLYLASYVNRAAAVSRGDYKRVLLALAHWCHSYIAQHEGVSSKYDHAVFYAATQALFYLITYRHVDIFTSPSYMKYMDKVRLHFIVHSRLNPLKHCNSDILRLFSKLMSLYEVLSCAATIEGNTRTLLPSSPPNAGYPFTQCLLPHLSLLIHPHYREMVCSGEVARHVREYRLSENLEDWDTVMESATSPDFSTMAVG